MDEVNALAKTSPDERAARRTPRRCAGCRRQWTYAPTGIFHDRLKLTVPFPVDIDLSTLEPRR